MINPYLYDYLFSSDDKLMIPKDNVATVREDNFLLHAVLVLTNSGFNSIPVLTKDGFVCGEITLSAIIRGTVKDDQYDLKLLESMRVKDLMQQPPELVVTDGDWESCLHALISLNYVCIADKDLTFLGIVPRSNLCKRFNAMCHHFDKLFDVKPKSCT